MARLPRLAVAGQPHHVLQRGIDRQPIFIDEDDRRHYLASLAQAARDSAAAVHAYALMADHVHLVVTPAAAGALGRLMQRTGRRYVAWFNRRHGRSGTLWDGRFRATVLDPDRYLLACMCHVERNPVRHGLAASAEEWPWSSARHHVGASNEPLISDPLAYWRLGNTPFERESAYRALLATPLPADESARLREATHKGWALGSVEFLESVSATTTRRLAPLARGRPSKRPVTQ